jgi:tetratricopeptide (TPR) repeat protein
MAIDEYAQLDATSQQTPEWRAILIDLQEGLGDVLELTGSHDPAREAYQAASEYLAQENVIGQARLLRKMGKTWESQRAYPEAQQSFASAIEMLERISMDSQTGWWTEWLESQANRLFTYYWMNKPQEMKVEAEKARQAFDTHGTPVQRRAFFLLLALMTVRRDRYMASEEALGYANAALEVACEWGATATDMFWRFIVGFVYLWCGELDRAECELQEGTAVIERIGDVTTLSRSLAYLTLIYRKRGQIGEARYYAQRTLEVAAAGQMVEYIGSAKGHQAWIALREGDFEQARALADDGYQTLLSNPTTPIKASFFWIIVWPLIAAETLCGQIAEAVEHVQVLLSPTQQPQPESVRAELEEALQAWQRSDLQTTHHHLMAAMNLAQNWGYV